MNLFNAYNAYLFNAYNYLPDHFQNLMIHKTFLSSFKVCSHITEACSHALSIEVIKPINIIMLHFVLWS